MRHCLDLTTVAEFYTQENEAGGRYGEDFSFCEMRSTEEVTTMRSALRASEGERRIFISRGLRERRHQVREVERAELKAELEDRARPAAAAIVY